MIPVGFYRPDLAKTNPGMSGAVLNAILSPDASGVSYGPHPDIALFASAVALPSAPRGIVSAVTTAGVYKVYFGTASNLYELLADGTYTEIGSGYALPTGDNWSMMQFGSYVYFTNTFDGMLRYSIEGGGAIAAVSGAPDARYIFGLFGAMAALDCDGNNKLLKTSKINDPTVWSGDASNQYQEFPDGEELIAGGEISEGVAVLFQRNAIRRLTATRDRRLFTSDLLQIGVGAQGSEGCVFTRGAAYFVDTDGFHSTNGQAVAPIGKGKVSQTFLNNLATDSLGLVQGAYDPATGRVLWRYRATDVLSESMFEDILAFDYNIGEWVPVEITTAALVSMSSPGYTLDSLDALGSSVDALPFSLDHRVYSGGEPRLAAVNSDLKFGFVSGSNLACTLEIGEQYSPQSVLVRSCLPVTDAPNATVQVGVKPSLSDSFTWGTAASIVSDGRAMLRGRGKVFSLRLNVPAAETWTYMRGFDAVDANAGGPR